MTATVVAHAISSFYSKWVKQQPALAAGDHLVDEVITLHVTALVKKLEDEEWTPTVKIPQLAVLAFLLPSLGATREIQIQKLRDACVKALALGGKVEDTLKELMKDIEGAFKLVEEEVTSKLPKEMRAGKTIVKECKVEEVGLTVEQISEVFNQSEKTVGETV